MKNLFSIITFLFAFVPTAFTQWDWISPLPTGNELNCTYFISPDTGFIYSHTGEIFKTTNGGVDWILKEINPKLSSVIEIKFLNHNLGYMLTRESIFKSIDRGTSWFELNTSNYSNFNAIHFKEDQNFWVVGDSGLVIHTTDDGTNWLDYSLNNGYANSTIFFLDDSIGFIGREFYTSLRTTNGGQTWSTIQTSGHLIILKYFFINSDTGFAVGKLGKIFRTTNRGQDWQSISPFNSYRFKDAFVTNYNSIFLFSTSGQIAKSTDYGDSWFLSSPGNFHYSFFSYIDFVNDSIFYTVGSNGNIFKTIDAGDNWQKLRKGLDNQLKDISFISKYTGWALSAESIYKTIDGGHNWIQQSLDTSSFFANKKLFIVNENIGYSVGQKIRKTTNGGQAWSIIYDDGTIYYTCYFINSEKGFVAGQYGKILMTTDGGSTFTTISDSGGRLLVSMFFVNENIGYMGGDGGTLLKSTDGGTSWNSIQFNDNYIDGIYFLNENNGCIVSFDKIYKTTDGGSSWLNTYIEPYSDWLTDIEFINEQIAVAVSSNNILTTTDGGNNWSENRNITNGTFAICSIPDSLIWICGSAGRILHSTNGGATFLDEEENNFRQPKTFLLSQNYPNPFNPSTKIKFEIPYVISTEGRNLNVILKVYDVLGNLVATLVNEEKPPGNYEIEFNPSSINHHTSSGIYFYQLKAGNFIETKKMVLLK